MYKIVNGLEYGYEDLYGSEYYCLLTIEHQKSRV